MMFESYRLLEHRVSSEGVTMPAVMKLLDKIAREKQRDVLFVTFRKKDVYLHPPEDEDVLFDWQSHGIREDLIAYLEMNEIPYQPCFPAHPTNGFLYLGSPYNGQLYIDVPVDLSDPVYQKVEEYCEKSDGSSRFPEMTLWIYDLERAKKNSEHDEPGFWDDM